MPKTKSKSLGYHHTRAVIDCEDQSINMHRLPKPQQLRDQWLNFIFNGEVPVVYGDLHVCWNHFTTDCYENLAMVQAGFAKQRFSETWSSSSTNNSPVSCKYNYYFPVLRSIDPRHMFWLQNCPYCFGGGHDDVLTLVFVKGTNKWLSSWLSFISITR